MEEEGHHLHTLSTALHSRVTTFDLVTRRDRAHSEWSTGLQERFFSLSLSPSLSLQFYNWFFRA